MLPDFPLLKRDIDLLLWVGARGRAASISGAVPLPRRDVYEGSRHILVRENGEVVEGGYDTVSAEDSFQAGEAGTPSLRQVLESYTRLITEMDRKGRATFVELANEEAESRGQVVERAGRPLAEPIMEAVERMELDPAPRDVDELFLCQGMRVMLYELDQEAIEKVREELKREPYRARMTRLLAKKREEYRARESSRKLVG